MYALASTDAGARTLRAPRANRVFCTDKNRIRTENTVLVKSKTGLGLLFIQDRRLRADGFSSAQHPNTATMASRDLRGHA